VQRICPRSGLGSARCRSASSLGMVLSGCPGICSQTAANVQLFSTRKPKLYLLSYQNEACSQAAANATFRLALSRIPSFGSPRCTKNTENTFHLNHQFPVAKICKLLLFRKFMCSFNGASKIGDTNSNNSSEMMGGEGKE